MEAWLNNLLSANGLYILYFGTLFILIFCGIGLPVPEEVTFLAAGFAASQVKGANQWILCIIGITGIMIGDSIPFFLGMRYGISLLKRPLIARVLTDNRIKQTEDFFNKHGAKAIFIARFVAGLRMPTFFLAATMRVKYRTFFSWDLLGALISCPTSILLAFYLGPQAKVLLRNGKPFLFVILGLIVVYIAIHYWRGKGGPPSSSPHPDDHGNSNQLEGESKALNAK